jgi:hypothetical protein
MKILVCDRCGFELAEKDDINLALEGSEAWQSSVRNRGREPRGVYPCKHHMLCEGEMVLQNKKRRLFGH